MAAATGRSLSAVPGSDQDPRVITSVSMPRSELEQLDALAAEHGVSRNRLVRAALRMAAHGQEWRLRAHLASLPRSRDVRERVLDSLTAEVWLTQEELAAALRMRPENFRAALGALTAEHLVIQQGRGVRGSPLRYRRTYPGERRQRRWRAQLPPQRSA